MLNFAQLELLKSVIGSEGIYFETIRDYVPLDLGTKIFYLERAMSEDCQTFLQSLDKVYHSILVKQARIDNEEFIRALKWINDCYFNNDIKNGDYGNRPALTHYFGSIGRVNPSDNLESKPTDIQTTDDFQKEIEKMIRPNINDLERLHPEAKSQKKDREVLEKNLKRETGWRVCLDLPLSQLEPDQELSVMLLIEYNELLTTGLYDFSSEKMVEVLRRLIINKLPTIIKLTGILVQENRGGRGILDEDNLRSSFHSLVRLILGNEISWLVNEGGLGPADIFPILPSLLQHNLLSDSPMEGSMDFNMKNLVILSQEIHMPWKNLLEASLGIDKSKYTCLLKNPQLTIKLINEMEITFQQLLVYDEKFLSHIVHKNFLKLNQKTQLSIDEFAAMDPLIRGALLEHSQIFIRMIDEGHTSFEEIVNYLVLHLPMLKQIDSADKSREFTEEERTFMMKFTNVLEDFTSADAQEFFKPSLGFSPR